MVAMIPIRFMNSKEPKYRANVAAILRHRDGRILICERIHVRNAWQFPQGGVDEGESLEQALVRELGEEIGLAPGEFRIVEKRGGYRYRFPSGRKKGFEGKEQTYFLCDFLASDDRIDLETHVPEFRKWKWIAPSEFRRAWLPPMKLDVYAQVFRDFFQVEI